MARVIPAIPLSIYQMKIAGLKKQGQGAYLGKFLSFYSVSISISAFASVP